MFFFSLAVFAFTAWLFPWWMTALSAFAIGCWQPKSARHVWPSVLAAALAFSTLAYVQDGANYGQVSKRLAGMLALPHPALVFPVMAIWGAMTVLVCQLAGVSVRTLLSRATKSSQISSQFQTQS